MTTQYQIRKRVRKLLDDFNIINPPVDVYAIAQHLKIKVTLEDLEEDVSGLLIIKNKKPFVAINRHHHPNRQRFTLAHECGHFLLHCQDENDELFVDSKVFLRDSVASTGEQQKEIEANRFAAELLMPVHMLKAEVAQGIDLFDDYAAFRLAKTFGVSEQALGFRLNDLGMIDLFGISKS